jgi:hypothetical protein
VVRPIIDHNMIMGSYRASSDLWYLIPSSIGQTFGPITTFPWY